MAWKDFELIELEQGLQEIHHIGSGVLLFPSLALMRLPRPWFAETLEDKQTYQRNPDQDVRFVDRLRLEAGYRIWVDTSIDKVKHIVAMPVDSTFSGRFEDWDEKA
jgi:hypothetical protein